MDFKFVQKKCFFWTDFLERKDGRIRCVPTFIFQNNACTNLQSLCRDGLRP